jgi:hypothetical protein
LGERWMSGRRKGGRLFGGVGGEVREGMEIFLLLDGSSQFMLKVSQHLRWYQQFPCAGVVLEPVRYRQNPDR